MKKIAKYLFMILSTAWTGALTIFSFVVMGTGLFQIADKFLNNNIVSCIVLAGLLICVTLAVGTVVHEKLRNGGRP